VLNNTRPVLPATRSAVEDAVRSLQYRPSAVARGLQTNRTGTIGAIVANVTSVFFAEIVRELEAAFEPRHYNLIVCNTDEQPERERRYLEMLFDKRVDAIVMVPTGAEQPMVRQYQNARIPLISIYRKPGTPCGPVVMTDEFASAFTATDYLIQRGHRRIGVLARGHNLTPVIYRTQGYMHALRKHHIPIDQRLIEINYRAPERTADAAKRLFSLREPISAVIGMSLSSSLGLLKAMRELGVSYPDDVSVLGIGDAPWMEVLPAPLTVMAAPTRLMARQAAELALTRIDAMRKRRDTPSTAVNAALPQPPDALQTPHTSGASMLPAQLIERASCRDHARR
jgi:DNA-binding LacI/PurR family transcriptional regulator